MVTRALVMMTAGAVLAAGCSTPGSNTAPAGTGQATTRAVEQDATRLTLSEPCASRLHDIAGPLLVYLTTNYRLPENLEALRQMPGGAQLGDFVCPTSGQPYIYNPAGVVGANVSQRAVIYDAAPTHDGRRRAIVIREATPHAPFIAEVVAWPESRFPKMASQ